VIGPVLHVAAQPFPSPQGTQAAIASMLEALTSAGREHHLLCYPHTDEAPTSDRALSFPVHRATDWARFRSLRSGLHRRKLLADAELALAVRRCIDRIKPALVVAHHVEAAVVTAGCARRMFFAHTALGSELPTYSVQRSLSTGSFTQSSRWLTKSILGRAGTMLDATLVRRAHAIASVSPMLVEQLRRLVPDQSERIACVLPPWTVKCALSRTLAHPYARDAHARADAIATLGLEPDAFIWLYTGNLDGYQGIPELLRAVAIAQALLPKLTLLVATASDPAPLLSAASEAGVRHRIAVRALGGERERALMHAAADAAVVPRIAPGGLPIKLLDALSRGVPCVVTPTACAGLQVEPCVQLAERDDGDALAAALLKLIASPDRRIELAQHGARYIAEHHDQASFVRAFDHVARIAVG
jgi:glycosyltransferase involved in cell wall biosynthesis